MSEISKRASIDVYFYLRKMCEKVKAECFGLAEFQGQAASVIKSHGDSRFKLKDISLKSRRKINKADSITVIN